MLTPEQLDELENRYKAERDRLAQQVADLEADVEAKWKPAIDHWMACAEKAEADLLACQRALIWYVEGYAKPEWTPLETHEHDTTIDAAQRAVKEE